MKLVMTSYRLGEMSGGLGETSYDRYSLGEMSEGFGEASYDRL